MEIVPQWAGDDRAEAPEYRPFRITWRSWLVFAIYVAFCALWPIGNRLPLLSATWGMYFALSFLVGAAGVWASWAVYRLARRSNGAANFLFVTIITAAFCATTFSMVHKADEYGVDIHGAGRPGAAASGPKQPPTRDDGLRSGLLAITREAGQLNSSPSAGGADREARISGLIGRLDAAAADGASTPTVTMLQMLKAVRDDTARLQAAFRSFHRGGGLDAATLDSTATLHRRAALARELGAANQRSLAFLEDFARHAPDAPAGDAAWVSAQFRSAFRLEAQKDLRRAVGEYVRACLAFFDFLEHHWGQ